MLMASPLIQKQVIGLVQNVWQFICKNSNSILKSQIISSTSSYLQRQLQMLFIFSLLTRLLYQIKEQLYILYAFKQAIEDVFQIEGSEIGADVMGEEKVPNLLIYENAEGSLGVLERLVLEPASYHAVVKRAYEICYGKKLYHSLRKSVPNEFLQIILICLITTISHIINLLILEKYIIHCLS